MLTLKVVTPNQAPNYYDRENYYADREQLEHSQWLGKGAKHLKLKALNSVEKRKRDTSQKILLGSWVLNQIENGQMVEDEVMAGLDKYLTKNIDRKVFDLPLLEKKNNQDS